MENKEKYFSHLRKIHAISHLDIHVYTTAGDRLLRLTTQTEGGKLREQRKSAMIQFREHIFATREKSELVLREQGLLVQVEPYAFVAVLYSFNKKDYLLFAGPFYLLSGSVAPPHTDLPAYTYDDVKEFTPLFSRDIILSTALQSQQLTPTKTPVQEQAAFAYNNAATMMENRAFEVSILNAVRTGDIAGLTVLWESKSYVDPSHYAPADRFRNMKNLSLALNTMACRAAEDSKAPIDVFVRSMCAIYAEKIERAKNEDELRNLRKELIFTYCRKVAQSSIQGYSVLVRAALSYMDAHLSDIVTLSGVAEYCGVSAEHLSRTIKKECHMGFGDLLNNQRIQRAKLLLLAEFSPHDAAEQSGFKTVSHFCRIFKEETGMTATQWIQSKT